MVEPADLRTMRILLNHGAGDRKIHVIAVKVVWFAFLALRMASASQRVALIEPCFGGTGVNTGSGPEELV